MAVFGQDQQQKIRGTVIDQQAGFPLPGVNVLLLGNTDNRGTATDIDGNFVLDAPVGRVSLQFSYMGYAPVTLTNLELFSAKELILEVALEEDIARLDEIVVSAEQEKGKSINEMSAVSSRGFSIDEATRYSGGRNDVARLSQSFAGVGSVSDDRNDIVIRGNAPTGVLWRLEGVDIPNPNHFGTVGTTGGPVSILNINNLKDSDFITGAFAPEYGNALSGVFDLNMRNGNADKYEFLGQMGFNGLELGLEGPLSIGKRSSFALNYRYSTLAIASALGLNFGTGSSIPKYQDLTFKVNVPTEKLGRFSLWGLGGFSDIEFIQAPEEAQNLYADEGYDSYFDSRMATVGFNHLYFFDQNTSSKVSLSVAHSGNGGRRDTIYPETDTRVFNDRIDNSQTIYQAAWTLNKKFNAKNTLRAGLNLKWMDFALVDSVRAVPDWRVTVDIAEQTSLASAYVSWLHRFDEDVRMTSGIYFQRLGLNGSYVIEPRLSFSMAVAKNQDLSIGLGMHSQMQPLVTYFSRSQDVENPLPNQDLDFTKSFHVVMAYDWKMPRNWRLKAEVYQQYISGAPIDANFESSFSLLNSGADFVLPHRAPLANKGTGFNYGAEFTLEKFLSEGFYALSTLSLFNSTYKGSDGINRNTAFNGNFVSNFLLGKEWKLNAKNSLSFDTKLTYAGGKQFTPIDLEASQAAGREILEDGLAFSEQHPAYFRSDLKFSWIRNAKSSTQQISVDIQNITNNKNVFLQEYSAVSQEMKTIYQIGLFPVIEYQILF